jgi:uncharacterized protein YkwD
MRKAGRAKAAVVAVAAMLTLGCAVPLPAAELTATAESRSPPPAEESRISSGGVQAASAGAVRLTADDGEENAVLDEEAEEATPTAIPAGTPTPPAVETTAVPVIAQPANYAADALAGLNSARNQQGLPTLTQDAALTAAAMVYARYMAEANFFGHAAPDGSTPRSRIAAAGFGGLYKGEALSAGQESPGAALQALFASPQHAAILLERTSLAVGVGYYYSPASYYKHYWVVVTGNP